MRLVEDESLGAGQNLAEAFALDGEVGKQQMVIDHHHIRFLSLAPGLDHIAVVEFGALAAQAVVGGGRYPGPDTGILRHRIQFHAIAVAGQPRPGPDFGQIAYCFAAGEARLLFGQIQSVQTQIIRAALEQGLLRVQLQRGANLRQIAMEELILQGLGTGGDDDPAIAQQCRDQIGKGLAGAGAGFDHQ